MSNEIWYKKINCRYYGIGLPIIHGNILDESEDRTFYCRYNIFIVEELIYAVYTSQHIFIHCGYEMLAS